MSNKDVEQKVRKVLKEQFGLGLEDIHTVKITLNLATQDNESCFEAEYAISDAIEGSEYKKIRVIYGGDNLNEIFLASSATPEQLEVLTTDVLPNGAALSKIEELDAKFYGAPFDILNAVPK